MYPETRYSTDTTDLKQKLVQRRTPTKVDIRGENVMLIDPKIDLVKSYVST